MFKYIFSDLPDEKCLLNNNVKTFFVDVEYEKGKDSGRPNVIISYGSKSVRLMSSEVFQNKIEYKNDIICTIMKFIILNCEEQLPIIYFNNETILTRPKFFLIRNVHQTNVHLRTVKINQLYLCRKLKNFIV